MLDPADPLTDDALTGRYRLWQRKRGHRYSLDDVLTARVAAETGDALCEANGWAALPKAFDLGCGIGSVLLMVADRHPEAACVGLEAQDISFALLERNVARNNLSDRITIAQGDLRDEALLASLAQQGPFPLVSGTPPYQPPGTATPSPDSQRAHCRIELRGGIEDYLQSAAQLLAPGGRAVICGDARRPERAYKGAAAAGLRVLREERACPRAGRPPLFTVWTFGHAAEHPDVPHVQAPDFVARNADGERTQAYLDLRAFFGLPAAQ